MAKTNPCNYQRYLCPVSGFFNALEDGREEVNHHEADRRIYFRCPQFEASSYYYFLSDEIILFYQYILPYEALTTKLQSHRGKKFFLFVFFHSCPADVSLQLNQKEFTIREQSFLFTNSNCNFQISEQPQVKRAYFQMIVTEKFIREYVDAELLAANHLSDILSFSEKKLLIINNYPKLLQEDFNELIYFFSTGHADEFSKIKNFKIVTNFLTEFFKTYHISHPPKVQKAPENSANKEALLKKYLDENVDRPYIGSAEMAKRFHMSGATLNRHFVKAFHLTPFEYFRKAQMDYAKKLLLETDLSVSEIAYKLGFHTPANFIRSFKKVAGLTPGAYKKRFADH